MRTLVANAIGLDRIRVSTTKSVNSLSATVGDVIARDQGERPAAHILWNVEPVVTMLPTNGKRWAPMHPNMQRRAHGAEFKARALAECK